MGAFKNIIDKLSEIWKAQSKGRRAGIIVLTSGIAVSLIFFIVSMNKINYEALFMNMSSEDMAKVVEKLKADKVDYKLDGGSILVPENKVEELRLSVASSGYLPSNGKGFELFDVSKFGMTDTETKIQYQRALEGELQRTVKGLDAVENAVVHLVIPEDTVFARDKDLARASVTLKLKNNKKLLPDQVKAIVALISGSVKNLPEENVVVVDSNYNYLSENLFNNDMTSPSSISSQQDTVKQFEFKIEENLKKMLEAVYGPDKVKVTVNADLDFDSKATSSIKYDPAGIIKSQNIIKETITSSGTNVSGSPIDNQTSNTIPAAGDGSGSTREEVTTNYNVGQVEEKIIKAPGQVKKMSTSIVIDGTLSDTARTSVNNIAMSVTGYDQLRGDLVTVEGIPFDDTMQKKIDADIKQAETIRLSEERNSKLISYIGYPAVGIIALIFILILISKMRSSFSKTVLSGGGVDVVINEPVTVHEVLNNPMMLEDEVEKPNLTSELKKYATKRPEQVAEIIKSWLAEDER